MPLTTSEMEKKPVISIITVVYNDRDHIEATIQSVLDQSYENIQYIIVDGGSTDGTSERVDLYRDRLAEFISERDDGIYDAMNKGLKKATGDYVLFLNSADRLYERDTIQKVFSGEEADIFYGETAFFDKIGQYIGLRSEVTTRRLPDKLTHRDFLMGMPVSHQAFIVKRSCSSEFNTSYYCSADIDWCIKCLIKSRKVIHTGLVISKYMIGGHSHRHQKRCWAERFRILRCHFGLLATLIFQAKIIFRFLYKGILLNKKY